MNLHDEKMTLLAWFDIYYAQHEQKYRRLQTLGRLTDEGADPLNELIKLYTEAENKRVRLKEIESLERMKNINI